MKHHKLALTCIAIIGAMNSSATTVVDMSGPAYQWTTGPWNIRYVLFVDALKSMRSGAQRAIASNSQDGKQGEDYVYLDAEALFTPTETFVVPGAEPLATFLISFNTDGRILNKTQALSQLTGKRTGFDRLVLLANDFPATKPYEFADWTQHIPGDATASPPLCIDVDLKRYGDKWKRGSTDGDFGCREWIASLYRWQQQYIDVTTYTKHGNFIGKFIGWSRFSDPPKPVIGMHGKVWLCLHDCPYDDKPGVIPDIHAWAEKNHFPVPRRPARQPEYPDKIYKEYRWEVED